jgi:ribosomal protein S18 acetylase RimI-like enzyme
VGGSVDVREFCRRDQRAARELVLEGLGEHWGFIDASRNPDLDDIAATFASGHFACAWLDGALVGTGGFMVLEGSTVQIHRMSVARGVRRRGIGTAALLHLVETARSRGFGRVVLETTDSWADAIAFYERNGFRQFAQREGDAYFERALVPVVGRLAP